jgi:alginate O-acetyltransferase complex protein AlgI
MLHKNEWHSVMTASHIWPLLSRRVTPSRANWHRAAALLGDRWHISLSSWLRDYLYILLGGNRQGGARTYFNPFVTMLLGGLWHGAAWNYVLWGAYQGASLCGHRLLTHGRETLPTSSEAMSGTTDLHGGAVGRAGFLPNWVSTPLRITIFFVLCCYGWLLFRAHSFDQTKALSLLLLGFGGGVAPVISKPTNPALLGIVVLFMLQLCDYLSGSLECFRHWRPPLLGLLYANTSLHIDHGHKQYSCPVYLFPVLGRLDAGTHCWAM